MICLQSRQQMAKCNSHYPNLPKSKKLYFLKLCVKTIAFFDSGGIIYKEFVADGETINPDYYKGVMSRLLKRIARVCLYFHASEQLVSSRIQCTSSLHNISCSVFDPKNVPVLPPNHPPPILFTRFGLSGDYFCFQN